ncbi:MAG: phosphatase PAP2 family protein [Clostridia bacterium]|nr:phosphatase PAP2 family protein [Clostridia bacterium]
MNFWERHAKLLFAAKMIHHLSVIGVYAAFPFLLVSTFLNKDNFFLTALLVCGWSFVLLSLYRKKHNAKRPSEVYNIPSAIERDKKGKSFPSRHSFSAVVIAVCLFHLSIPLGIAFLLLSLIIAALRVALGLHFVKDVLWGLLIGVLCGVLALIIG